MHFQHSALISWLIGHKMVGLCQKAEKCQQRFAYKGHKMPSLFYSSKGKNTDPKTKLRKEPTQRWFTIRLGWTLCAVYQN